MEAQQQYASNKIFFARSDKAPENWSFDHVGFVVNNKFVQMSGHKGHAGVYIVNKMTDDPHFSSNAIKMIPLSKSVQFTNDTLGSENCGTFVHNVLKANGINMPLQQIYSIFKTPRTGQIRE